MPRGEPRQLRPGGPWYADQYDPKRREWSLRSTRMRNRRAAAVTARRWMDEGERLESGATTVAEEASGVAIERHFAEYIEWRRTRPKKPSAEHLAQMRRDFERIVEETGWSVLADVELDGLLIALMRMSDRLRDRRRERWEAAAERAARRARADGDGDGTGATPAPTFAGLSPASLNHFRSSWGGLMRWSAKRSRVALNPLVDWDKWAEDGFRSFERGAMTMEQAARLLDATRRGETACGIPGPDRAMLYLVALTTGLRLGELGKVTVGSFKLDGPRPHVRVLAPTAKNKKETEQPLEASVAAELAAWLAGRDRASLLWRVPESGAEMIRGDLVAAGLPTEDEDGRRLDFHALRHTFCTWCGQRMSEQQAVEAMRHSDAKLTRRYTHVRKTELHASVSAAVSFTRCAGAAPICQPPTDANRPQPPTDTNKDGGGGSGDASQPLEGASDMPSEPTTAAQDGPEPTELGIKDSNLYKLIQSELPTDLESVQAQEVMRCAKDGAAPALRDRASDRPRHARERADAGLKPDLGRAFEYIRGIEAIAAAAGGGR